MLDQNGLGDLVVSEESSEIREIEMRVRVRKGGSLRVRKKFYFVRMTEDRVLVFLENVWVAETFTKFDSPISLLFYRWDMVMVLDRESGVICADRLGYINKHYGEVVFSHGEYDNRPIMKCRDKIAPVDSIVSGLDRLIEKFRLEAEYLSGKLRIDAVMRMARNAR